MNDNITTDLRFSMVPAWVLDSGISDKAIRLYAVLAGYADSETGQAYPGRTLLSKRLDCSTKTVDRAVLELMGVGAIKKQQRVKDGHYQSSLYTVVRIDPASSKSRPPVTDDATPRHSRPDPASPVSQRTRTTELEPNNDIAKRAKQVPADWQPDEKLTAELREKFPTLSLDDEVSAFVDYGQAKGATYKDFNAAFRNWCRNSVKFHGPKTVIHQQPASKSPYVGGPREWVRDMHELGEHFECREGEFGCK